MVGVPAPWTRRRHDGAVRRGLPRIDDLEEDAMGIFGMLRRDDTAKATARRAMKEARSGEATDGGAVQRLIDAIRDIGLDGKLTYSSAQEIARKAQLGRARKHPEEAVRRIIRSHRRGVTAGGVLTARGGATTLPLLLATNVRGFYAHAARQVR